MPALVTLPVAPVPEVGALAIETKLFRGLANPARLGILSALRGGPRTAGELAASLSLTPSNASNHLRCLLECSLVRVESNGPFNVYRLADPAVGGLLDRAAELLAEIAPAIEACLNYGPPSRRALRPHRPKPSGLSHAALPSDG